MKTSSRLALMAVLVLAAACGGSGLGAGLEVIVPPGENGELPGDLIVSCPSGPSFPVSALSDIPDLSDADPGGVAAAIAPFLQSEEGAYWPQEGWRMLHQTDDEVLLVHQGSDGLSFMSVEREGGQWDWSGASGPGGECPLQYTVPEGLNTVEWHLDPSAPPPGPDETRIAVVLNERECVSGQPIGERLVGPQVVVTDTRVHIAFAAQPPPGDAFDCQGNPDIPFTVELPEPLGDRVLVEGLATGLSLEDYLG